MAKQNLLVHLDLNKNEVQNTVVQNLSTAPSDPNKGQIYVATASGALYVYDGSAWQRASGPFSNTDIATNAAIAYTKLNLSGAVVNADISASAAIAVSKIDSAGLASTITGYRLDQFAAPTAAVAFNSQKITGLADPTNAQDAATKAYVDAARSGLDVKASVRAATTAPITLSGPQTVDGVSLVAGDRVLVKDQSTGADNGIWVVAASTWARATDADTDTEVTPGLFCFVEEGTTNADSGWVLSTNAPISVGTTALTFTKFSSAGSYTAGAGLTQSGNAFTVDPDGVTVYLDVTNKVAVKSSATSGQVLRSAGSGSATWGALNLASSDAVSGALAVTNGGTGATTAGDAKTNLGFMTRAAASVGNGSATSFTVTHNLGTTDVVVAVYANADGSEVLADVARSTTNTVTVSFNSAPSNNQYRVVVIG